MSGSVVYVRSPCPNCGGPTRFERGDRLAFFQDGGEFYCLACSWRDGAVVLRNAHGKYYESEQVFNARMRDIIAMRAENGLGPLPDGYLSQRKEATHDEDA